ncbi:MAG TPA: hypothetical protein EYN18_06410 [Nitrospirales bacterium]|nr:hypothetical protein [Nitrospirales bacterium]HIO22012.1 hypothetical protein [Nitrospirales bacterium]
MLRRTFSRERVVAGVLLLWLCVGVGGANTSAGQTVQELIEQAEQVLRAHSSYPDALAQVIPLYRAAIERNSKKALLHRRLAWACLEFGGLVEVGHTEWYRCGQQAAERALELDETNAEAHFLYAATTGLLSEQLPFWRISPKTPFELEQHLSRALALDPKHARALNMMGMLLNEVPGPLRLFLHGEKEQAEGYLTQAVDVDPTSTRLRLLLAEYYHEAGKPRLAAEQAKMILGMTAPKEPWLWHNKHKLDAQALLRNFETE